MELVSSISQTVFVSIIRTDKAAWCIHTHTVAFRAHCPVHIKTLQLTSTPNSEGRHVYVTLDTKSIFNGLIIPEYFILCSSRKLKIIYKGLLPSARAKSQKLLSEIVTQITHYRAPQFSTECMHNNILAELVFASSECINRSKLGARHQDHPWV